MLKQKSASDLAATGAYLPPPTRLEVGLGGSIPKTKIAPAGSPSGGEKKKNGPAKGAKGPQSFTIIGRGKDKTRLRIIPALFKLTQADNRRGSLVVMNPSLIIGRPIACCSKFQVMAVITLVTGMNVFNPTEIGTIRGFVSDEFRRLAGLIFAIFLVPIAAIKPPL